MCDEIFLKLEQEFQVEKVIGSESFLTNDCLHCLHVFANSVAGILLTNNNKPILRPINIKIWQSSSDVSLQLLISYSLSVLTAIFQVNLG